MLGCDGKTLIHPSQVRPANEVFAPSTEEISWAKTVIDAFELPENQGKGVLQLEGQMVELLHAETAKRVLAIGDAIQAKSKTLA